MRKRASYLFLPIFFILFSYNAFADLADYNIASYWVSDEAWGDEVTDFTNADSVYCNVVVTGLTAGQSPPPIQLRWFKPNGEQENNLGTNISWVANYVVGIFAGFHGWMVIKEICREPGEWYVEHWAYGYADGFTGWHHMFTKYFILPQRPCIGLSPDSFEDVVVIDSFASPGQYPEGLAFDGNFLWNTDEWDERIYKLDTMGNIVDSCGSPSIGPTGLAFDGTYLWNADYDDKKIYKIDISEELTNTFNSPGTNPSGLTFDGTYFWNADPTDDKIYKIDNSGDIIDSFDSPGSMPTGLAFDGTHLWNADLNEEKIYKLDTFGNIIDFFDSPGFYPEGLAFDGLNLWNVDADDYDEKIFKLDTLGNSDYSFDSFSGGPSGLAFDGMYLWQTSWLTDEIYKLDTSGNVVDFFDTPGENPQGLAFDGKYLWNADDGDQKIYKINHFIDSPAKSPEGVTYDGTYIWIADSYPNFGEIVGKIYKLNTQGTIIDSFNSPGTDPTGLAFDGTCLWNADNNNDKIHRIDTSGTIIDSFDSPGTGPKGLTFDGTYLWNADSWDERIYKLETPSPVSVGSSRSRIFTVTSVGSLELEIGTLSLSGANASEFNIRNDLCSEKNLTPSQMCTFEMVFSPGSAGTKTAEVEIPSNDETSPELLLLGGVAIDMDACAGDFDDDEDVDGSDLAAYIADPAGISLNDFAAGFGRTNCPP